MRKAILFFIGALMPQMGAAQRILGDTAYGIKPLPYVDTPVTDGLLEQEQMLRTIYLCIMLLAIAAALATYWIMRKRVAKYSEAINLQSQALGQQKRNAESFGLILNLALFPCCLIEPDGKVVWCNDAFAEFYGKERKCLLPLEGAGQGFDLEAIKMCQLGTTLPVRMKGTCGRDFDFKRTIIPVRGGQNGFAIIENITEQSSDKQ